MALQQTRIADTFSSGRLQVKQLNLFFNKHQFEFKLAGITRTTNQQLYTGMIGNNGKREYPFKQKTRRGSWSSLNIWVTGGQCFFDVIFECSEQILEKNSACKASHLASVMSHFATLACRLRMQQVCVHTSCAGSLLNPQIDDPNSYIAGFAR